MGSVISCYSRPLDEKLMITKMDLSHCRCLEVPHIVFNSERCIETLILASNQISSLPPQLFHCQEMKHLNLNDNCLSSIPPAIGSFLYLVSLKLDKNNLQELPENLKMCKKLKRLSLNSNPWKQVPNVVTQLISLEELYMNDCELSYLPASVGRLSKLKILEIRNNNLCNLPLSMRRLESLIRLDISDNEFNEFPHCVSKLKSLKELLVDSNDTEEITDIKSLIHLEHLDASYNHISKVSETIGCCTHLSMLNLSFNYIEQMPNSVGSITYLQTLQLEMNELAEIPKSIGKLSYLEELNLCNNKLHSLPSTIGLLRHLRNLNVSKNFIEEFPPEIGSCSKLGIINAAYNRLRILPSEIGYLNNLKVLDLVGNFLMYLPITIINLRGVRAIWLSANQNVPLIPFTEDINIASGERFLTNIALPQLGEMPSTDGNKSVKKDINNEKSSSWSKKISFAEDEDILPGKLHRTPTPFPKELRAPNRRHQKSEESKRSDNYVNVINGKVSEQETPLLPPTSVSVVNNSNVRNITEGCPMQVREANIRRNNRDVSVELNSQDQIEGGVEFAESEYYYEIDVGGSAGGKNDIKILERQRISTPLPKEESSPVVLKNDNIGYNQAKVSKNSSPSSPSSIRMKDCNDGLKYSREKFTTSSCTDDEENSNVNFDNLFRPVIYSNLVCDDANKGDVSAEARAKEDGFEINSQRIREVHHDVICKSRGSNEFRTAENRLYSRNDFVNGNVEPRYLYWNNLSSREHSSNQLFPSNINNTIYRESSANESLTAKPAPLFSENFSSEPQPPLSKQDFISIAEQMKNRNITPPCYEIAKMYSTKAALFENNRLNQLKFN